MSDMEAVQAAINGDRGDDQKRIALVGLSTVATLLRKNSDYGCSVWEVPVLAPNMTPGDAILVRMSDKVNRLKTLLGRYGGPEVDESIEDTLVDLGAYAILYRARPVVKSQPPITKTQNECVALNAKQRDPDLHPLTCPHRTGDPDHEAHAVRQGARDVGILVASFDSWVCPVCSYRQPYDA